MRNLTGQSPRSDPHTNAGAETPRSVGPGSSEDTLLHAYSENEGVFGSTGSSQSSHENNKYHHHLPSMQGNGRYPEFAPGFVRGGDYTPSHSSTLGTSRAASLSSSANQLTSEEKPFLNEYSPFGGFPVSAFPISMDEKEQDDYLHNPDPLLDTRDRGCLKPDRRNIASLCAFVSLVIGILGVFVVLPVLAFTGVTSRSPPVHGTSTSSNNTSSGSSSSPNNALSPYRYNLLSAIRTSLLDSDTPQTALSRTSRTGEKWDLVFSDEFELEGRSFYDGDDQFWTAVDIHYQATQDLDWYDPDAATTKNGFLEIRLDAFRNHNLNYRSAMVQSWNKFCFTGGYIEIGARLPGNGSVPGLWPGLWTLGNLGRPGYLATTEGLWPYSYNNCDYGITPNQSSVDGISYLKGQRLPSCTCPNGDHPNRGVGRGAPEIDIIEGTVQSDPGLEAFGQVSQSVQVAPMDIWYMVDYQYLEIYNSSITTMNSWCGGPLQQAVSGITNLNNEWYELSGTQSFQSYGFEYNDDDEEGYISWYVGKDPVYTMYAPALGPNGNVGARQISKEPMSIIMNLGISTSWTYISWLDLTFPVTMSIDYVRVYQPAGNHSTTCDPQDYPTAQYISDHINAYSNANLTSWADAGHEFPNNTFMHGC